MKMPATATKPRTKKQWQLCIHLDSKVHPLDRDADGLWAKALEREGLILKGMLTRRLGEMSRCYERTGWVFAWHTDLKRDAVALKTLAKSLVSGLEHSKAIVMVDVVTWTCSCSGDLSVMSWDRANDIADNMVDAVGRGTAGRGTGGGFRDWDWMSESEAEIRRIEAIVRPMAEKHKGVEIDVGCF